MAEHKPLTPAELADMRAYTAAVSPLLQWQRVGAGANGGYWELVDASGEAVLDDGSARSEYPPTLELQSPLFEAIPRWRTDMPRLLDEVEWLRRTLANRQNWTSCGDDKVHRRPISK